jgi:hypothetical protein
VAKSAGRGGARQTVPVIGLDPAEVPSVRALISLLRHPDPTVGELARHALDYFRGTAAKRGIPETRPVDNAS